MIAIYEPGDRFATMSREGRATLYTVSTTGEPVPVSTNPITGAERGGGTGSEVG